MQRDFWTRVKSRKFLMALANFIFIATNELSGTPIDREAYFAITGGIIAFIAGESAVDFAAVQVK